MEGEREALRQQKQRVEEQREQVQAALGASEERGAAIQVRPARYVLCAVCWLMLVLLRVRPVSATVRERALRARAACCAG